MSDDRKPQPDNGPPSGPMSGPRSVSPASQPPSSARAASSGVRPSNPVLSGWPVVERGLLMAYIGRILVVHMSIEMTPQSKRRHLDELARAIDTRISPIGVLYDVPSQQIVDAMDRKEAAALLKAREEKLRRLTTAFAMATPSMIARGVLNAVFWLAPPPYMYSVVSTVTEGLNYLATHTEGVSARLVEEEYRWLLEKNAKIIDPKRRGAPDTDPKGGPSSRRGAALK